MNTEKRYIKRIVVPVALAAIIAVTANMIYRAVTAEPDDWAVSEVTQISDPAAADPTFDDDQADFTPQKLQSELNALQMTLTKLDNTLPEETSPQIDQLKNEAEQKIQELADAGPSNWVARRDDAYDTIQDYALAVGRKRD